MITWNSKKLVLTFSFSSSFFEEGKDVTTDAALQQHWHRYKHKYAALPTTTHFTERAVKISNLCSKKGRGEERVSHYAIKYNAVSEANSLAKKEMASEKEKKGGGEYENVEKLRARGKLLFFATLNVAKGCHDTIEAAICDGDLESTFKSIRKSSQLKKAAEGTFQNQRQEGRYKANNENRGRSRGPNAIELQRGVDITPFKSLTYAT